MKKKQLNLSKETVRKLSPDEMTRIAGGGSALCTYNCTQVGCPPPKTPGCPM